MKKVLITGKNSYIGNALEKWLAKEAGNYKVATIDMENETWRSEDFSLYDVIFHVAGIAHVSSDPKLEKLYYRVNRDLAIETAKKAKAEGIKQFIFMSSIIVYGNAIKGAIDRNTVPAPGNIYGQSKLQAEEGINNLESDDFKIIVLRPPMIYGKGCRGNYPKLASFALKTPIFPDYENKRSMLHIDNLCEFIKLMIDNEEKGLYFPQNKEYVNTSELVKAIAAVHGKKVRFTRLFNPFIRMLIKEEVVSKVFGNLFYEKSMSRYSKADYQKVDFRESVRITKFMT